MVIDATALLARFLRRAHRGEVLPGEGPVIGFTERGEPVRWPVPAAARASHVVALAASGAGKTVIIAYALVLEFLAALAIQPGLGLVVSDPKGDLVAAVFQALAAIAPEHLGRVVYLNPFGAAGFPFNLNKLALGGTPIDIRAQQLAGLVATVSTASGAQAHLGVGARQVDVLTNVLLAALDMEDRRGHPLLALDALTLPSGCKRLAALTRSVRARQFLANAHLSDELQASCAARIRLALAASTQLERLICAPTCIQFEDVLSPGRIVLIDIGEPIGGLTALSQFWANTLGRLVLAHLLERPSPWAGHHVRLVNDEAQIVAAVLSDVGETILTTGRSRGVSLVTISQGTTLLHAAAPNLVRVLLTNSPTRFVGRLGAPDAELLARELAPGVGVEETLSAVRSSFVSRVTNLPDRTFYCLTPGGRERFTTVAVDTAAWAQAATDHADAITVAKERLRLRDSGAPRLTLDDLAPSKQRARRSGGPRSRWG